MRRGVGFLLGLGVVLVGANLLDGCFYQQWAEAGTLQVPDCGIADLDACASTQECCVSVYKKVCVVAQPSRVCGVD